MGEEEEEEVLVEEEEEVLVEDWGSPRRDANWPRRC
jgi:hypothetical protein